jgi:hypothetical protein
MCLAAAAAGAGAGATPGFHEDGRVTLECHGTTTADGGTRADTRSYAVDTKRCAIDPWPAAQCKCIDETIQCDNRNEATPGGLIVNRLTGKVIQYRANWKFVGRCKKRSP